MGSTEKPVKSYVDSVLIDQNATTCMERVQMDANLVTKEITAVKVRCQITSIFQTPMSSYKIRFLVGFF